MLKTILRSLLGALATVALAASASSQCLLNDGLTGPCCTTANAQFPPFPPLSMPGMGICWTACNPTQQPCVQVNLGPPIQTGCARFTQPIGVLDCNGQPMLTGSLVLDYTRNWEEAPTAANVYAVWRFAVKVDLNPGIPGIVPMCPAPSCLTAHPTAFYYGYLDYAFNCAAASWEGSLVLYHACDDFIHDPLISDRPGVFHPGTSYAIVAPVTTANPFLPAPAPAPGGTIVAEALRSIGAPPAALCRTEEMTVTGNIAPLGNACACPFGFVPPQVTARLMNATTVCGSSFASVNLFPNFPWLHIMTTSIGNWTTGASYPGPEVAWVDEGPVLYNDGCAASVFGEVHYGGSTAKGFPVLPTAGVPLTQNFTDLASNYSIPLPGPVVLPIVGSVRPSRHLAYYNVP